MSLLIEFLTWLPVALGMAVVAALLGAWIYHTACGCKRSDWWKSDSQ